MPIPAWHLTQGLSTYHSFSDHIFKVEVMWFDSELSKALGPKTKIVYLELWNTGTRGLFKMMFSDYSFLKRKDCSRGGTIGFWGSLCLLVIAEWERQVGDLATSCSACSRKMIWVVKILWTLFYYPGGTQVGNVCCQLVSYLHNGNGWTTIVHITHAKLTFWPFRKNYFNF